MRKASPHTPEIHRGDMCLALLFSVPPPYSVDEELPIFVVVLVILLFFL